jgi:hypothetical protein
LNFSAKNIFLYIKIPIFPTDDWTKPLGCMPAEGHTSNEEKFKQFSIQQMHGAFLADYADLWTFCARNGDNAIRQSSDTHLNEKNGPDFVLLMDDPNVIRSFETYRDQYS